MRITIGKYIPSNSPVHSMDPRQKIVSTLIVVISVLSCGGIEDYIFPVILITLYMFMSSIKVSNYIRGLKNLWFIIAFAVVVQYLSYGLEDAIYIFLRLFLILLAGEILSFTTSPTSLSYAMEDLMRSVGFSRKTSQEFSMVMAIALRFTPILIDEADRIAKAQMSRGAPLDSKSIVERIKALVSIVVPLMYSSMRKAEELAIAMEVRGFVPGKERTRYRKFEWKPIDHIGLSLSILTLILVILF